MSKALLIIVGAILLGATVYLATSAPSRETNLNENLIAEWKKFKLTHNQEFANPDVEFYRMSVFASNLNKIQADKTGTIGVTQFAHLTQEEFVQTYLTLKTKTEETERSTFGCDKEEDINVNWVQAGKVTAVKNQLSCGSCWAFSATGAIESALILAGKATKDISLSEQQMVSCSIWNMGCNGGWMDNAFSYVIKNGQTTSELYPYTATKTACEKPKADLHHISSQKKVESGCTSNLKNALKQQPITIAVDATNWNLYKSGVFSNCETGLNHGVLLVGFEDNSWIVKNSWGTNWGESGFIRLANGNTCGLANNAVYPIV